MGETETGLSIFWPDGGLDTGDVLLQKTMPIGPDETLGTVYFEPLFPMGVEALLEAVDLVKAGTAPRDQAGRGAGDLRRPLRARQRAHRLGQAVAADPRPGARLRPGAGRVDDVRGHEVQLFGTAPLPARDLAGLGGAPGEVVAVTPEAFTVVCADGRICVKRIRPAGGAKTPAGEWAASVGLAPGSRLGGTIGG